jgi:hypothetical protein
MTAPEHVYRFRSIERLLGKPGELEQQEIYLSASGAAATAARIRRNTYPRNSADERPVGKRCPTMPTCSW